MTSAQANSVFIDRPPVAPQCGQMPQYPRLRGINQPYIPRVKCGQKYCGQSTKVSKTDNSSVVAHSDMARAHRGRHLSGSLDEKVFQNVIALSWGKGLVADLAIYHRVVCTGLRSHPNNLVTRFTARAGKVPGAIVVRFVFLFQC
jgi:hypothetical protein